MADKEQRYFYGSFKVDVSDVHKKIEKFARTLQDPTGVYQKTISDMKSRAPGIVADAVRTMYNIKKSEVMPSKKKTDLKNAANIRIVGDSIATLKLEYRGRKLTPLHFGMTPTKPTGLSNKEIAVNIQDPPAGFKKGFRTFHPHKKYKISSKITKTKKVYKERQYDRETKKYLTPFLAPAAKGSSRIIPFQREADGRDIVKAMRTIAVPQMLGSEDGTRGNQKVRQLINSKLGEVLEKRFNHHVERLLDKATK